MTGAERDDRSGLVEIGLGPEDREPDSARHGASAKVEAAAAAVLADGAVVLADAIDAEMLDRLAARMDDDLAVLLPRPDRAVNFVSGHLQQDPPPTAELLAAAVLAHPFAVRVCREVLGQPHRLTGVTNNTNLSGSWDQPVHVDEGQLWPGLSAAHPPSRLTVNIPLSDVLAGEGAIELWPGTHLDPRMCRHAGSPNEGVSRALHYLQVAKRAAAAEPGQEGNRRVGLTVPEEWLEARRLERPPVAVATKAGSMIIRDPRLWHRGTANSGARRFMLALTHDPNWRQPTGKLRFPTSVKEVLETAGIETHADYTDEPVDHLGDRHVLPQDSLLRRVNASISAGAGR